MDSGDAVRSVDISASPSRVYAALTTESGLTGWWTTVAEVGTRVGETITFRWSERDYTAMRIDVLKSDSRVEWTCVAQHDTNLPDPAEWVGTRVIFDLTPSLKGTKLVVRHVGLLTLDCGDMCSLGWMQFLTTSIKPLAEIGVGQPWVADG
ncbi:SRPBCC domain-containing protein [Brevibacterium sp.]|uniref:SRPBCC family protein n=1 Tax=Brevibacterium sp. TaxID=1701 RepID=UPI0028117A69|nr:SRPBCC domain-containing protein [Brevibacterium sp.]